MSASRVTRVVERAGEVWYGAGRPGGDSAAIGVIAALTMLEKRDKAGPDPAALLAKAPDEHIEQMLAETWARFWVARPELAFRCEPFAGWLNDDPRDPGMVRAVAAVTRAVLKAGLYDIPPGEDIIGHAYTEMRTDKARQARGEYYTPHALTHMMGLVTLAGAEPGQSICDPCAGTGGMFLGAATALIEDGKNPADYWWYGNDISPVAVAGLAVNAFTWDLGRNVVIGCSDSLAEPDWHVRAAEEQAGVIAWHRELTEKAGIVAAMQSACALVEAACVVEDAAAALPTPNPSPAGSPLVLAAEPMPPPEDLIQEGLW